MDGVTLPIAGRRSGSQRHAQHLQHLQPYLPRQASTIANIDRPCCVPLAPPAAPPPLPPSPPLAVDVDTTIASVSIVPCVA